MASILSSPAKKIIKSFENFTEMMQELKNRGVTSMLGYLFIGIYLDDSLGKPYARYVRPS